MPEIPEKLKPAFEIFMRELETHLGAMSSTLNDISRIATSNEDLARMANRFHTIKGGAGFFQLNGITEPAGRGEKMMQNSTTGNLPKEIQEELESIVSDLKMQADALKAAASNDDQL